MRAPKILAHQDGVERHHAAIGEAEHDATARRIRRAGRPRDRSRRQRLHDRPATSTGLAPTRSASTPNSSRPPRPEKPGEAVDRDRRHRRDAADHGVADHVEDRPGMRGAAGEMRQRERDELRRAQRLRHGPLRYPARRWRRGSAAAGSAAAGAPGTQAGISSAQAATPMIEHRGAPVVGRDQPARERRDRHRRDAHAGRHQRDRKAAVLCRTTAATAISGA